MLFFFHFLFLFCSHTNDNICCRTIWNNILSWIRVIFVLDFLKSKFRFHTRRRYIAVYIDGEYWTISRNWWKNNFYSILARQLFIISALYWTFMRQNIRSEIVAFIKRWTQYLNITFQFIYNHRTTTVLFSIKIIPFIRHFLLHFRRFISAGLFNGWTQLIAFNWWYSSYQRHVLKLFLF